MAKSRSPNRAVRDLAENLRERGWIWERTNGGHVRWRHPQHGTVFSAGTPSDWRAVKNLHGRIRRAEAGRAI